MTEKLLNDDIVSQVTGIFNDLKEPVQILYFGDTTNCDYCDDTLQLITEIADLSDKIDLAVNDIKADHSIAEQYKVDKAPGIVIAGCDGDQILDYGIRIAGIPSGHEFSSLIHTLLLVSARDSGLKEETRDALNNLTTPVHMYVFVTPTCPYCPSAVVLAHKFALESPMIDAEMIEATEFPELSQRFHVSGVPQTTINLGDGTVIGSVPENQLLAEILEAVS